MKHTVSVFCGARGKGRYSDEAYHVGHILGSMGVKVIFGGGGKGSMKSLADGVLENGGECVGYLPAKLQRPELMHLQAAVEIVADMEERKSRFWKDADSYLCLPGGLGSFDELFAAWTMIKLGYMDKKIAILNHYGFFDPLKLMVAEMVRAGFLTEDRAALVRFFDDNYQACKWLTEG